MELLCEKSEKTAHLFSLSALDANGAISQGPELNSGPQ